MNDYNNISETNKILTCIIAFLPILGPYAVTTGGLAFPDIILIFVCFVGILKSRCLFAYKPWFSLLVVLLVESFIAMTFSGSNISFSLAIRVSIMFFIYLFGCGYIWNWIDNDFFIYIVVKIGLVCAIFAIIQFIFVSAGFSDFYTGRFPFPLSKYGGFGSLIDITGSVRVHSFFEEPSYLALYEIPIFAYCLQNKKYKTAAILAISCVLSGTVLGIMGIIIVVIATIILGDLSFNRKVQLLGIICLGLVGLSVLYLSNDAVRRMIYYYIGRYNHITKDLGRETSSLNQRLFGNMNLFSKYNTFNQLFGVGINQYANYFGLSSDYSNDIVCTFLNYGFGGIICLLLVIVYMFCNIKKQGIVQIVFFIVILAVDHIWFNEYFFYILTWIIIYTYDEGEFITLTLGNKFERT